MVRTIHAAIVRKGQRVKIGGRFRRAFDVAHYRLGQSDNTVVLIRDNRRKPMIPVTIDSHQTVEVL